MLDTGDGGRSGAAGQTDPLTLISKKELIKKVLYSGQHIGRLERAGKFPRRVKLGENRVGWVRAEIDAWIAKRMRARPTEPDDEQD